MDVHDCEVCPCSTPGSTHCPCLHRPESGDLIWKAPPERKASRVARVATELRARPGEWALIHHEEGLGFMPWWGPLHESPDFETRFDRKTQGALFGPRDIYARYVGTPPGASS